MHYLPLAKWLEKKTQNKKNKQTNKNTTKQSEEPLSERAIRRHRELTVKRTHQNSCRKVHLLCDIHLKGFFPGQKLPVVQHN